MFMSDSTATETSQTATATSTAASARGNRKERLGEVISNKMAKTIIVRVERRFAHPRFKKVVTGYKKLYAHDEKSEAKVGDRYLVYADTEATREGDLLYLGTWQEPQVRSLSGASSAGIAAPLIREDWFPHARAFEATAPKVRVLVYSEAVSTNFLIRQLSITHLKPKGAR